MKRLFRSLGKVYPKGYRSLIDRVSIYSGSEEGGDSWLGKILVINLIVILSVFVIWRLLFFGDLLTLLLALALPSVVIQVLGYFWPYYIGDKRAKAVEGLLPNFYQLLASYLRSGMTPYQALKSSSRKEFGILQRELDIATSSALGTQSFTDSLMSITNRINSESLRRSTELMVRGIESGGSLAKLLEESSSNLIENRSLRREIIASSRTYTLMVIFAVVVGAPLLLSISTMFNERLVGISSRINEGAQGLDTASIMAPGGAIDQSFLWMTSFIMVGITALISSFLIGIISEGKEKYGVKYAIIFVPLSMGFFWLFGVLLGSVF